MSPQHKELAAGRWAEFPLFEQMAHIGGDVERALNWRARKNAEHSQKAFERALELIDLSLDCASSRSRLRELARLREAVVDFFAGDNQFQSSDASWRKYFLPFAYAVRCRH